MRKLLTASLVLGLVLLSTFVPLKVSADGMTALLLVNESGIDDKSFNQSAWEGMQAWGEANGKERGPQGYDYLQSLSESDYTTNLNNAANAGFDLIFGLSYKISAAIDEAANQHPDNHFVLIDAISDNDKVASIVFKDQEAAFLAGAAAALRTKTNKVGFVGGTETQVIERFEAGYVAGVKAVNPEVEVLIEYVGSYNDMSKARQIASMMYNSGVDIIYHAAGGSGNGVFAEAKDLVSSDPSQDIWVIGVDMDQDAEGIIEVDGQERHLTLTSSLKLVGNAIKEFAELTEKEGFKPEVYVYGLADDGVYLTEGQLTEEEFAKIQEFSDQIKQGDLVVPDVSER